MAPATVAQLLDAARARLDRVTPSQVAADPDAVLLDIRSETQRAADGVIPGALWHPRNVLEWRADPASGFDDPTLTAAIGRRVVVICHEGYQSSLVAATLQDLGYARATDLEGGFRAWRVAGLPVAALE